MGDQKLCNGSEQLELTEGDTLIREGELGDTAFCIVTGEVRVWKSGEGGSFELARLGPGSIFGEMSMVDEKPRSASVTATCPTCVKLIRRSEFFQSFQNDPEFAASLLKVLFERLRETGARLTQLQQASPFTASNAPSIGQSAARAESQIRTVATPSQYLIRLEGLTGPAQEALPSNPMLVESLPLRIGRQSDDPMANNDLSIRDFEPFQISVNHLLIFEDIDPVSQNRRVGIFDRGSSFGSWLDGRPLGGLMAEDNATYLDIGESQLVLGSEDSVFRYRINVSERQGSQLNVN